MTSHQNNLYAELRRLSPKVTGALLRMRQDAYRDAVVPAKYKLLAAMAISVAVRCKPCIQAYVRMVVEKGISQEELLEFLDDHARLSWRGMGSQGICSVQGMP